MRKLALISLLSLALWPIAVSAQLSQCTITATAYSPSGALLGGAKITVVKVVKNGALISNTPRTYTTASNGVATFTLPRASTAWIYFNGYGLNVNGTAGVAVTVPNAATANLEDLANLASVLTTLGDTLAASSNGVPVRVAGNTTTTPKFLTSIGNGTTSALPGYYSILGGSGTDVQVDNTAKTVTFTLSGATIGDGDKGDITVSSSGAVWTVDAGLAVNKLAAQTASRALVSDGSGFLTASATTATEIGYVSGVTSAIQTQLDARQPLDSDLTSIAALSTTSFGRGLLTEANAGTARTTLGLVIGTDVQAYDADLTTYAGITPSANVQTLLGAADYAAFKTSLSLNNVENTALSTWAGSTNLTTLGTISTGTWQGTAIADSYISSAATWNAKVGPSRTISTGAGLSGGGDLSANRTLDLKLNSSGGLVKNLGAGTDELGIGAGGVTNAMLAGSIAYSKLSLSNSIVDADVHSSAAIGWSKISKSGSSLADLATRAISDTTGNLAITRLDTTGASSDQVPQYNGSTVVWANAGGGTPANPTAIVGLSAVNGSASTYMRSDAAPALDQAIAPTWTGAHIWNGVTGTFRRDSLGTTSTDGLILENTTAAAAGAQQYSPRLVFTGQGWKTNSTAASQTVNWSIENRPVQGAANPTTSLIVQSQVNGGGYTTQLQVLAGQLIVGNTAQPLTGLTLVGTSGLNSTIGVTSGQKITLAGIAATGNVEWASGFGTLGGGSGSLTISTAGTSDIRLVPTSRNLFIGVADAASPGAQTLGVQSVVAGTSNTAGANFTLAGSRGTGTGAGGSIIFQTAPAGGSGTSQNSLSAAFTVNGDGSVSVKSVTFANLPTQADAKLIYCSDCTVANPCAGSGTGALAKGINGAWVCN